ncbi:MAG: hypothetical protein KatS3mg001_093 [Candidatus Pacearchaeota archaeon]|nr:MAG: hypothetical protein KatS3mg001_093 [Candidatus Pacearchaeota archaeon]
MVIREAGNVGIGTTNPQVKLAVNGAGANIYATDVWVENNMHVQGNEDVGSGRGRLRIGTAWNYVGLYAETNSGGASNDLVLGASSGRVRIGCDTCGQNLFVSGNVGIGTTGPGAKLDVQGGNLRVGSPPLTGNVLMGVLGSSDTRNNNYNPEQYYMGVVPEFKYNSVIGLSGEGTYSGLLTYRQWSSGTDWSGGGVHQLAFGSSGNIWHRYSQTTGSWGGWARLLDTANVVKTSSVLQIDGTGNSYIMGNVGIGTTGPSQKLDVRGRVTISSSSSPDNGYNGDLVITKPAASGQYINLIRSGNYPWSIGTVYSTSDFAIGTGKTTDSSFTSPEFVIKTTGYVGIGTTNPGEKLEVAGNAIISGNNIRSGTFGTDNKRATINLEVKQNLQNYCLWDTGLSICYDPGYSVPNCDPGEFTGDSLVIDTGANCGSINNQASCESTQKYRTYRACLDLQIT